MDWLIDGWMDWLNHLILCESLMDWLIDCMCISPLMDPVPSYDRTDTLFVCMHSSTIIHIYAHNPMKSSTHHHPYKYCYTSLLSIYSHLIHVLTTVIFVRY